MADADDLSAPGVLETPASGPSFNPSEWLGFDPWPPRRALNPLQHARVARGMTQEELAAEVGVSRHTVSSMENRHHVPSVRLALAVAAALRGTVEELFGSDERR